MSRSSRLASARALLHQDPSHKSERPFLERNGKEILSDNGANFSRISNVRSVESYVGGSCQVNVVVAQVRFEPIELHPLDVAAYS